MYIDKLCDCDFFFFFFFTYLAKNDKIGQVTPYIKIVCHSFGDSDNSNMRELKQK